MVQDQASTRPGNGPPEETGDAPPPRYVIDPNLAAAAHRSLPMLIAGRRCYACQSAEDVSESSEIQPIIDRIAEHCEQTSDFLLPDTPLKEAIFRVILAGGNQPRAAAEISRILSDKWALTAYPRDASPKVVQRLLDHSASYCVARVAEPEAEETEQAK